MDSIQIAVRLKTPDPEAVTVMNAFRSMGLQLPPLKLQRHTLWQFQVMEGGKDTVSAIAGHFTDIVNPNKHIWCFAETGSALDGEDADLQWTGIVVRDHQNSESNNWTELLNRRGFPVKSVRLGALWRFGYLTDSDEALIQKMAMDLSVSRTRTGGLLSNPVSQEVSIWI